MEDYYRWLCSIVYYSEISDTHDRLTRELFNRDFEVGPIAMDINRAYDGINLRSRYAQLYLGTNDPNTVSERPCSILEMMIALAEDMEYILIDSNNDLGTSLIFWEMVRNLGLMGYTNDRWDAANGTVVVNKLIDRFLNREYTCTGLGGMFPLANPRRDQRVIEIWDQAQDYILEKYNSF